MGAGVYPLITAPATPIKIDFFFSLLLLVLELLLIHSFCLLPVYKGGDRSEIDTVGSFRSFDSSECDKSSNSDPGRFYLGQS